jgi:hypothetical protein
MINIADALMCAYCSKYAYNREQYCLEDVSPCGGASVFRFGGQLVLAVRGTSNIKDWMTDDECILVPWHIGKIHAGFCQRIATLLPFVNKYPDAWITGHSLGAAVATGLAWQTGYKKPLYTFESPRLGNKEFAMKFKLEYYRFINDVDVVCHVPSLWGYHHVGTPVVLYKDKFVVGVTLKVQLLNWLIRVVSKGLFHTFVNMIGDHSIDNVIRRLDESCPSS